MKNSKEQTGKEEKSAEAPPRKELSEIMFQYIGQEPKQFGGGMQERCWPVTAIINIVHEYAEPLQLRIAELEAQIQDLEPKFTELEMECKRLKAELKRKDEALEKVVDLTSKLKSQLSGLLAAHYNEVHDSIISSENILTEADKILNNSSDDH